MIYHQKISNQPVKNNLRTYNYRTGCLLDYPYFKNYYKMIVIDLSKQKELDADPVD